MGHNLVMYGTRFSVSLLLTIALFIGHRSKVSSFMISYNTDRVLKRNTETYTKISIFPVYTGKIEHAKTVYQALSLSGRGLGTRLWLRILPQLDNNYYVHNFNNNIIVFVHVNCKC